VTGQPYRPCRSVDVTPARFREVHPSLKVIEATDAEEGVSDDEQAPPLADDLEALGH